MQDNLITNDVVSEPNFKTLVLDSPGFAKLSRTLSSISSVLLGKAEGGSTGPITFRSDGLISAETVSDGSFNYKVLTKVVPRLLPKVPTIKRNVKSISDEIDKFLIASGFTRKVIESDGVKDDWIVFTLVLSLVHRGGAFTNNQLEEMSYLINELIEENAPPSGVYDEESALELIRAVFADAFQPALSSITGGKSDYIFSVLPATMTMLSGKTDSIF